VNFRKKHNLTQQQLADQCSLSIRKYQRLEAGEASPSFEDLIMIERSLKIDIQTLIQYDGKIADYQVLTPEKLEESKRGNQLRAFIQAIETPQLRACSNSFQVFNLITASKEFKDSSLPLVASELSLCVLNPIAADQFGETPLKKFSFASITSNRLELVGLMNTLIDQDDYYLVFNLQINNPKSSKQADVACTTYFRKISTSFWAVSIIDE